MERDDEVFLDAEEEEVTQRRSGRKRRSTAGSSLEPAAAKKPKMPTRHSPRGNAGSPKPVATASQQFKAPAGSDQDAFWVKMGGMLGGLEARMKQETDEMKEQLGVAVDTLGDLGGRWRRLKRDWTD